MIVDEIYQDILALPESVQEQVRDYVEYLKVKYAPEGVMTEVLFWELMHKIDGDADSQSEMLAPLVNMLATLSVEDVYTYQDVLAKKLSALDAPKFWEVGGGSSDGFLYNRCYVIARGKEFYLRVLDDPSLFPKEPWLEFEALLYTPNDAYELKTGEELQRIPATNYESRFNVANWGAEAIQL